MIDDNKDKEEDNKQGLDNSETDMNDLWCIPCGMVVINKTKQ